MPEKRLFNATLLITVSPIFIFKNIKNKVDFHGCPSRKKDTVNAQLQRNHHKLCISGKVMKCAIRKKTFLLAWSNRKPTEVQKFQLDDVSLKKSGINTDGTIIFLHNSGSEGLLFKIVRGFFDIAICCFAIFLLGLLIKNLPISKNGIPHSFFNFLLSWESSGQISRQFVNFIPY